MRFRIKCKFSCMVSASPCLMWYQNSQGWMLALCPVPRTIWCGPICFAPTILGVRLPHLSLAALCSSGSREGKSWAEFGLLLPTHSCSLSPPWGCARGESCCATACDPSPEIVLGGSGTRGSWCCSAFMSCRPHGGTAPFFSSETRLVLTHRLQSPIEPFPGFW